MRTPARESRLRWILAIALVYVVIGFGTSELARTAASNRGGNAWRLAAWLVSFAVFIGHVVYDRRVAGRTRGITARRVAAAAALGAFGLAVVGPVRSHWGAPDFWRTAALSLVAWPIITGVPAFVVALLASSMIARSVSGNSSTTSHT